MGAGLPTARGHRAELPMARLAATSAASIPSTQR